MDVQQVRYFLAVAETGSFTAGAKRSGVTQPTLSQQIQQLERSLGVRLFDRLSRRVALTDAGRELVSRARQLVEAFDGLRVGAEEGQLRGRLSVGATPTLAPFVVAEAVAAFAKKHRQVEVVLQESSAEGILERMREGNCDVGIVGSAVRDPQILVEELFTENLVVAVPARHPLARRDVTLGEVMGETVIVLDELKDVVRSVGRGRKGVIRGSSLQVATAEALVAAGAGVCVLPAMARRSGRRKGVLYCTFRGQGPVRVVSAVWHRDRVRTRAAGEFMGVLREVAGRVL